ncbi:hypothetical protein BUALT_Bualt04G0005800 [Buddleja alternifolia]|uniref:Reverse transcriptase domain-containing protein n=1 Tax=Buddleja alternifolia TaxID=168488 RepID=A0AAV6XLK0_9LAMI|nr:hypothetical protein BUALT_Bualt04G0005800 [Buddleja alternifolia]
MHNNINFENNEDIKSSAVKYFSHLLASSPDTPQDDKLDCLRRVVMEKDNSALCAAPSLEEDIISRDIFEATKDFLCGTPLPRNFTTTAIVLIPKVDNLESWSDFRPISLCNVVNKIFSKLMCSKLASLLPSIIALSQGGFVHGQLISVNILLAQELVHDIDLPRSFASRPPLPRGAARLLCLAVPRGSLPCI